MLIDRVLDDLDLPRESDGGGNAIRGSRLGRCARQSAYMLWPGAFPPEPLPARTRLVFKFGDLIHDFIRAEFRRVLPGQWGMEESRFHFEVPLSDKEASVAVAKAEAGLLKMRIGAEPAQPGWGLTLDTATPTIWVPTHVDGIADLEPLDPAFGLASVEVKSMATGSFRKAEQGRIDYAYRTQMAVALAATGLDTEVFVSIRKDTCHLLEVIYTKRAQVVEVRITKHNQMVERLIAEGLVSTE